MNDVTDDIDENPPHECACAKTGIEGAKDVSRFGN